MISEIKCVFLALSVASPAALAFFLGSESPMPSSPVLSDNPPDYAFLTWQDEASWAPWGLEISDVDRNGIPELLVGNSALTDWDFRIYDGVSHKRLLETMIQKDGWHRDVRAGNMNDDPLEEIVIPSMGPPYATDTVRIMQWNGSSLTQIWGSGLLMPGAFAAEMSDLDKDGRQEAVVSAGSQIFKIDFNASSGDFDLHGRVAPLSDAVEVMRLFDIDGDGAQEAVVRNYSGFYALDIDSMAMKWSLNNSELPPIGGEFGFDVGDPDLDGRNEIVASVVLPPGDWIIVWIDVQSKSIERSTPSGSWWLSEKLIIYDVDQDRTPEIVATIALDWPNQAGGYFVVLDGTNASLEFRSRDFGDSLYVGNCMCGLDIGDTDNNPGTELLVATYFNIYQYNGNTSNKAPTAEAGPDITVPEGQDVVVSGNGSFDPDNDVLRYRWDFENDGVWDTPWSFSPYESHAWGDDYKGIFALQVSDGNLTAVDRANVTIINVPPSIRQDITAGVAGNLTLRVAGEKWHDVNLTVYRDGVAAASASVVRTPGSPDDQAATIENLTIVLLGGNLSTVVRYTPDDDPINGQPNGANPAWLIFTAKDGSESRLHHTFNVRRNETWIWEVDDLRTLVAGRNITFIATATDPGSDDLTFTWEWGDGTPATATTYYNDGIGPDPYPSPGGTFPFTVADSQKHVYSTAGKYDLRLTVRDDDGGVSELPVVIVIV